MVGLHSPFLIEIVLQEEVVEEDQGIRRALRRNVRNIMYVRTERKFNIVLFKRYMMKREFRTGQLADASPILLPCAPIPQAEVVEDHL